LKNDVFAEMAADFRGSVSRRFTEAWCATDIAGFVKESRLSDPNLLGMIAKTADFT